MPPCPSLAVSFISLTPCIDYLGVPLKVYVLGLKFSQPGRGVALLYWANILKLSLSESVMEPWGKT